jgi:hypothetical protein
MQRWPVLASPRASLVSSCCSGSSDLATVARATEAARSEAVLAARALASQGVKLLALDFDLTLVTVHTRPCWTDGAAKLALFFRPELVALIPAAAAVGISTAIVTFSTQTELIRESLAIAAGQSIADAVIIRGEDGSWEPKHSPRTPTGAALTKTAHIESAAKEACRRAAAAAATPGMCPRGGEVAAVVPEKEAVLLLDDDFDNIEAASKNGNRVHHVKSSYGGTGMLTELRHQLLLPRSAS